MNLPNVHNAQDSLEWAFLYALGELSAEEIDAFEQHLRSGCAECQESLRSFHDVIATLVAPLSTPPPTALKERLMKRVAEDSRGTERRYRGVLLQKDGLLITRPDDLPWKATPIPGVSSKALHVDRKRRYVTSLVRVEPRAIYPRHRHNDIEEVLLLEGDFVIDGVRMVAGDYCRSEPGSIHGQSTTVSGALLLLFASQQDELLL